MMKLTKKFISSLLFLALCVGLSAQDYENFYLEYTVEDVKETESEYIAVAKSNLQNSTVDKAYIGDVLRVYDSENKVEEKNYGEVVFVGEGDGHILFEIRLGKTKLEKALLNKGASLIRFWVSTNSKAKKSLVYEMERRGIGMYDVYGSKNLLEGIIEYDNEKLSADDLMIPGLLNEAITVAGLMRDQMDPPMITKGRFEGVDLFTAMEKSSYWDIYSFLVYLKRYPYKYMGVSWKFSEIYGTWIDAGAPGDSRMEAVRAYNKVKEELLNHPNLETSRDFVMNYFKGIDHKILKEISSELRIEIDQALSEDKNGVAYKYFHATEKIADYLQDQEEFGWCYYKKGQIEMYLESIELAIDNFESASKIFSELNGVAGMIVVNSELGRAYNTLETTQGYRKSTKLLEETLKLTVDFSKDNKVISPVVSLIYRHLGDSYAGLKKLSKALETYKEGLTYTEFQSANALKRRSALLFKISEVYETKGEKELAKEFQNNAVEVFRAYEKEVDKVKKL